VTTVRRICAFLFLMLLTSSAFAQNFPRAEVFGGYSLLHIDTQGVTGSTLDALCNNAFERERVRRDRFKFTPISMAGMERYRPISIAG